MTCMSELSRRALLKATAATAAVLTVPIAWGPDAAAATEATGITPYLRLHGDGAITALLPTTEMGQGIHTGQMMILADELGASPEQFRIDMPAQPSDPFRVKFGATMRQRSVGSHGIRSWHDRLRSAAAKARAVLILAGAEKLALPAAELDTRDGFVVHKGSGKKIAFADLVAAAAKLPLPDEPALRPETERTLIGKDFPRIDIPSKTDGSAVYGTDVMLDNMLHGAVRLAPVWKSDVESIDGKPALAMPGVVAVVKVPRGAVVVAKSWWQAKLAAEALAITFTKTEHDAFSSLSQSEAMRAGLDAKDAGQIMSKGDVAAALATAGKTVEAIYEVPMLAHMCMEPHVCTAQVLNGRVDLWIATQDHDIATEAAAETAGVAIDKVFIATPYLGGGFGRKGRGEIVVQAVLASNAVGGKPVKVMWSREDETAQGAYRPAMMARFKASVDDGGKLTGLDMQLSGPQMGREYKHVKFENNADPLTIASLINNKYQAGNQRLTHAVVPVPLPLSPWRSVSSSQNAFFLESVIDEAAHAAGKDPLQFRRDNLAGQKRHLAVLDKVAEMSKWGTSAGQGVFRGVALDESYGSVTAQVAEVTVHHGIVDVRRVFMAIDCGRAINPNSVVSQMQGSVIEGLGAALRNRITVENGRAKEQNFDTYAVMRINEVPPEIHVAIVEVGSPLGGAGEPGVPGIAPAVANAIFAATGKRVRTLPFGMIA
ncbi:MAG: molybdopterin cofactor-binding domain-containing protein [Hyphomicrobium sp.]